MNRRWLDYTGFAADEARDWGWKVAIHRDDVTRDYGIGLHHAEKVFEPFFTTKEKGMG